MPLPTFVIIGERRCGTTSLYHWLRRHPDIYLYPRPDMDYFVEEEIDGSRKWRDGEADADRWEQTHEVEEYAKLFREANGFSAIGHKGADLFFWRPAHSRMARYLPEARFILLLRNPVERAWSHYWNEVGKHRETLSFEEALAAEEQRMAESAYARFHLSYGSRGYYDRSFQALFEHIPPRRVLVLTLEDCIASPRDTLMQVYRFLGVDPLLGLEDAGRRQNENWTMVPRAWARIGILKSLEAGYTRLTEGVVVRMLKNPARRRHARRIVQSVFRRPAAGLRMPEELRQQLLAEYAPHLDALETLLDRRLPQWRR